MPCRASCYLSMATERTCATGCTLAITAPASAQSWPRGASVKPTTSAGGTSVTTSKSCRLSATFSTLSSRAATERAIARRLALSPTVQAMIGAMPSTRARSSANWGGCRRRLSKPAFLKQCSGTSTISRGCGKSQAVAIETGSKRTTPAGRRHEKRHHSRRRLRHPALPSDAGHLQATSAGVRQADDLLPAFFADARGDTGDPAHLHPAGHAPLPAVVGRWRAVGPQSFLCGATVG